MMLRQGVPQPLGSKALFPLSGTVQFGMVRYHFLPFHCQKGTKIDHAVPVFVTLSLGYQAVPKRPKRVELHIL